MCSSVQQLVKTLLIFTLAAGPAASAPVDTRPLSFMLTTGHFTSQALAGPELLGTEHPERLLEHPERASELRREASHSESAAHPAPPPVGEDLPGLESDLGRDLALDLRSLLNELMFDVANQELRHPEVGGNYDSYPY